MRLEREQRAGAVVKWWYGLQPRVEQGRTIPGDRAALARLRRADTVMQASMIPTTLDLCARLGVAPDEVGTVALIAAILAHVREDGDERFARQIGGRADDDRLISSLRFQRLIEAAEPNAQLTAFRRAIAQARRRARISDLAESLLDWNHPERGDQRRQRWLYDYYHTNDPSAPGANMEITA
ncbi:type I-E CRISPR-associated protein Cse2/CasB [Acidiphilium acidophilum]|uniref:type I-E CRISPR-associated protein Cse2/CasB n=1 Tax=Acidiphilium acidophilum TaxID=76588 RepID=UPI002E8E6B0B|nr:type I-E CRISPR-associated protein Cse2/CasB [Acidiphilium acidophilum]